MACTLCGPPLPGRGYDGKMTYTSTIHANGDNLPTKPNFVLRDDCGSYAPANYLSDTRYADYIYPGGNPYPGVTNAWCELAAQLSSADAFVNRDALYMAKTLDVPRGYAFDFWFCKNNGFLSLEARRAVGEGFEAALAYSASFCARKARETNVGNVTTGLLRSLYDAVMASDGCRPNQRQADLLGAWACAMGGTGGLTRPEYSDGAATDLGYCTYTYGDLSPTHPGEFCMYDECDGWDPDLGMPITQFQTASKGHTSPRCPEVIPGTMPWG